VLARHAAARAAAAKNGMGLGFQRKVDPSTAVEEMAR